MIDKSNEDAETFIKNNEKFVYWMIKKYYPSHSYDEDLIQCGRIGLWKTYLNYDENCGTPIPTFMYTVVLNELRMYFRKIYKDAALNNAVRLDDIVYSADDKELTYLDVLGYDDLRLNRLENLEYFQSLESFINKLSVQDRAILYQKLKGYNQKDIGDLLGISQSYVSRRIKIIQRTLIEYKKGYEHIEYIQ